MVRAVNARDAVRAYKGGFYLWGLGDVSLRKQCELKFTRGVRDNTGKGTKNLLGRGNSICKGLVEKWSWCLPRTKKSQSSSNKERGITFYEKGSQGQGMWNLVCPI